MAGRGPGERGRYRAGIATAALVSFRLGGIDGVSVEAAKWSWALGVLGFAVTTVAGAGRADHVLPGLAIDAPEPPTPAEVDAALAGADLVVVENLCSLPLNPAGARVVAGALRGRPALLHHYDLPWQRVRLAGLGWQVPDDPAWAHVCLNRLSQAELRERGIEAATIYSAFDTDRPRPHRAGARQAHGLEGAGRVVVQPTRAIARKNVPAGVALAEALGALYWLLGPAEEGYDAELARVLAGARTPVLHRPVEDVAEAYAAADVVAFPSTWEGFGNPVVESALARRPAAVGDYPVARELAGLGLRWFRPDDAPGLAAFLDAPDGAWLDHNEEVARRHFALADLPARLARVLARAGWGPW